LLMFAAMAGDGPQGHLGLIIAGFVLFNFAMNAGPNACDVRNFSGSSTAGSLGIDWRARLDGVC
ncbi:MAG: hypothetical protein WBA14_20800, partial [Pseudolabrys sp.]